MYIDLTNFKPDSYFIVNTKAKLSTLTIEIGQHEQQIVLIGWDWQINNKRWAQNIGTGVPIAHMTPIMKIRKETF